MILVDTSVLVDYLKGTQTRKTELFDAVLERGIPFGISVYTYQEVLQGARDEREYRRLRDYLGTQTLYSLPEGRETHEKAARLFFDLRRKGITVRGSIDVLVALTAMEHKVMLLHDDRDFDAIASKTGLAVLKSIP